ncbi:MAG TPA: hypothetical protein VFD51_02550 [Patescibacteria group bacterium]|nr:hypothetical protein [Patescibacteria group bacterium]
MFKKFFQNSKNKDLFIIILLIFFTLLTRLVVLLDVNLFIDGDEAIFGRMINDFINNGQWPLFFYGQNYGLVFFEVLLSAIVSLFFGINIFTMKATMLIFWLGSIVVLYYVAKKILKSRSWAFLTTILISSIPVWLDWSIKARGGYLTAFLLSNIVIYLSLLKKTRLRIIFISLFLVIIYYAQPLWLVILLPFVVYYLIDRFKLNNLIAFLLSGIIFYFISHFFITFLGFQFQTQNRLGLSQVTDNIKNIYNHYLVSYSGGFFDSAVFNINVNLKVISMIFIITFVITIFYNLYLAIKKRNTKVNLILLSSVLLYILFMLFYNDKEYGYRFLLPIFIPAVLLIVTTLKKLISVKYEKFLYLVLIFFAVISSYIGVNSYNHIYPELGDGITEIQRLELLEGYLNSNDVQCVYALDWLISQHLYYFMPNIASRHQSMDLRRPEASNQVDELRQSGNCALVGLWYQLPSFTSQYLAQEIMIIGNRYIVKINPSKESLNELNFELTN